MGAMGPTPLQGVTGGLGRAFRHAADDEDRT